MTTGARDIGAVRFGEGDVGSECSSTGHFTLFVIGLYPGHGDRFRFCTPKVK